MAESQTTLFQTVLSRLVESFTPHIHNVFLDFGVLLDEKRCAEDELLETVLKTFPREDPQYTNMISTLIRVAECNPGLILKEQARRFKNLLKTGHGIVIDAIYSIITHREESYQKLIFNFALIFETDLLCQLVTNYACIDAVHTLTNCGYHLCNFSPSLPHVFAKVLDQWSVIFSIVSETNFEDVTKRFDVFIQTDRKSSAFTLLKYIRMDLNESQAGDFLSDVADMLEYNLRRRSLTSSILTSASKLIITAPVTCQSEISRIFEISWAVKEDKDLKIGAYDVIVAAFSRLHVTPKRVQNFYQKKVFAKIGDDSRVKHCLWLFMSLIFGDQQEPKWLFWEWGLKPRVRPLCFIKWNSQKGKNPIDSDSYVNLFMKYFYKTANFAVCPELFRDILVLFASIDFKYFSRYIVPRFIELDVHDPRLLVMLMVVPQINSSEFVENAISMVTDEDIVLFNKMFKPVIVKHMSNIQPDDNHGICITDVDAKLQTMISESNCRIANILEEWKMHEFKEVKTEHMKSEKSPKGPSIEVHLMKCASIIMCEEDLESPEMMHLLLQLSFSVDRAIANEALTTCRRMLGNPRFIQTIWNFIEYPPDAETLLMCMSLLNEAMKLRCEFEKSLLHDMELAALIGLTSRIPATRHVTIELLERLNSALDQRGLLSCIIPNVKIMGSVVKQKMLRTLTLEKPHRNVPTPIGEISYLDALHSHYIDVWMMFLAEIGNIVVVSNYEPLLKRIKTKLRNYEVAESVNIGIHILISAAHCYIPVLNQTNQSYTKHQFLASEETSEDTRSAVASMFEEFILRKDPATFTFARHVNITAYPHIIALMTRVSPEQLPEATNALAYMLRNPGISSLYMKELIPDVFHMISVLQGYFTSLMVNGPRVIRWTPAHESSVREMMYMAIDYCIINWQCFSHISAELPEDEWPISAREVAFRFLVNWATTQSPELRLLRDYANMALGSIVRTGHLFIDSLLFDASSVRLFSSIEMEGIQVLNFLLYSHAELLLETYIEACYVEPRTSADLFFEAIFVIFDSRYASFLVSHTGPLVLLGMVYQRSGYPKAKTYLQSLLELTTKKRDYENITKTVSFATEAVIEAAIEVLQYRTIHVQKTDVIESMKPWISNLRLLPKQQNCVPGIPSTFGIYAPYQFLVALMEATETIGDDNYASMASIWSELMQCKDHHELIPLFLCEWHRKESKCKLLRKLISMDPSNIMSRLVSRCSFAYHFYITSLGKDWSKELWIIDLITEAYHKMSERLVQYIPSIIHFAFLCYDWGHRDLLEILAKQFDINLPSTLKRHEDLIRTVRDFIDKMCEDELEIWGMESLRWLLGCQNMRCAFISLTIYNQILRPMSSIVVSGVCKATAFHVVNSIDNPRNVTDLVAQAFAFYLAVFSDNEQYAFSFACCFIDCKVFVDTCLPSAIQLFVKALSNKQTNKRAWGLIVGIVRPLLSKLESDTQSQKVLTLLIKISQSHELQMIVAPIKESHPGTFASVPDLAHLIPTVSETVMCKSLVHYASMLETASPQLLNSIFRISALIVQRIVNENNRGPLAKIYKVALSHLCTCDGAKEFVRVIAKSEPAVASKSVFEFYDWDRSLEDVCRSLGRLIIEGDNVVTLTDCSTLESVYNLLTCDVVPTILPFAAHREMLDGMLRMTKLGTPRTKSFRKSSYGFRDTVSAGRLTRPSDAHNPNWNMSPLSKPKLLHMENPVFKKNWETKLVMTPEEFFNQC